MELPSKNGSLKGMCWLNGIAQCGVFILAFYAFRHAHSSYTNPMVRNAPIVMSPLAACFFLLSIAAIRLQSATLRIPSCNQLGRWLGGALSVINLVGIARVVYAGSISSSRWMTLSPASMLLFAITGVALCVLDWETKSLRRPAQGLAFAVALGGLLYAMGHMYKVPLWIPDYPAVLPMAYHSAIGFMLLGLALLGLRPQQGLVGIIASQSMGGVIARTMLPVAIIAPVLLGYIRLQGELLGFYGTAFSAATFALSTLLISSGLIIWVSMVAYRLDSDRQKAQVELTQSQAFLESIVENIPNMIFVKEADNLRFVRFNRAGEKLLGLQRDTMIGRNDFDFFPKAQAEFFTAKDREVLANKELVDIPEEPIETPFGQRMLHTKKIPIYEKDGTPRYLLGISEDITELRKTQEELLQGRKLQAVGQLAAGVAHEINNPLAVILGFTQNLLKRAHGQELDCLLEIEREVKRCRDLVQNLLSFSRHRKPGLSWENPNHVLNAALLLVKAQAKIKRINLIELPTPPFPQILIDGQQMQQVIINLCNNALDAMTETGTLTVQSTMDGNDWLIVISDTGVGIPKELQEKIFEPFFTTKEPGKGTGLGLSMVYDIVQKHHGRIELQSDIGRGTSFKIRIPSTSPKKQIPKAA